MQREFIEFEELSKVFDMPVWFIINYDCFQYMQIATHVPKRTYLNNLLLALEHSESAKGKSAANIFLDIVGKPHNKGFIKCFEKVGVPLCFLRI